VTKREQWIEHRAIEIWGERLSEREDFSFLKALSQAAREWREQHQKRGKVEVRQIGWLDYT
jgi:hypothetical protein